MAARFTIVGLGEALFDVLPDGPVLGGAPLNVAVHAHQLAQVRDGRGVVVSRVGQDAQGDRILRALRDRGMETAYIQTDPDRPTGEVFVSFDEHNQPQYDIVRNVAWDNLWFDPDSEELAKRCDAVCFGSLAQRDAQSRSAIYRFLDTAARAIRLFDVNLRQDYYDSTTLRRSLEHANALKLNVHELTTVCDMLGYSEPGDAPDDPAAHDRQAGTLLKRHKLRLVALTRGEKGTVLYAPQGKVEGQPVRYPFAEGADSVGAGDACAAALLVALALRMPLPRALDLANHCGAYVASQPGATPALPQNILDMVK